MLNYKLSGLDMAMLRRCIDEGGFYVDEYIEGMPRRRIYRMKEYGLIYIRHTPLGREWVSITPRGKRAIAPR